MSFEIPTVDEVNLQEVINYLDDLTDAELIHQTHDLQNDVKRLELENQIYEKFLMANEPLLISSMGQTLDAVKRMQYKGHKHTTMPQSASIGGSGTPTSQSRTSYFQSDTMSVIDMQMTKTYGMQSSGGPRINISQKTDLVMREIEATQNNLKKFIAVSHRRMANLKAEIEESNIRATEVQDSADNFEQSIIIGAVEKLTQKIPAEKFLRYMQEWLKTAQFMLEKLRLRTSSLRIQQTRLKNLLTQKEELGECVHEVDFEKLKIENKNYQIKIEQKNSHLLELKRINGKANLMMTNHKKILQKQDESLKNLKKSIKETQKRIIQLEAENDFTEQEVQVEKEKYTQLKRQTGLYQVPDVMTYIKMKAELNEMNKTLKTWRRKSNIQKIALSTYTKMMVHQTGIAKPRASWYDLDRSKSEDIIMEDYVDGDDASSSDSSEKSK